MSGSDHQPSNTPLNASVAAPARPSKGLLKKLRGGYGFPVVISLSLHILGVGLVFSHWLDNQSPTLAPVQSISASLVEVQPPKPAIPVPEPKKPALEAQKRQAEQRRQAEIKRQKAIALKKEKAEKEKAAREKAAREQKAREEHEKKQAEARRQAEIRARQQAEEKQRLEQKKAASLAAERASKDASEVSHYAGLLQNLIAQNWSRPPSARNNMEAVIQVSLSSFGDLLEVKLLKSSGSGAFDSSVIRAIRRAAPFPELKQLDRRVYENSFKRINFRFRPEDLVR